MSTPPYSPAPSIWERRLAGTVSTLVAMGILGIIATLIGMASHATGAIWSVLVLVIMISLPLAIVLLVALVVANAVRRKQS